jgi:tripeptidyl-peptidase I
MLMEMDTSQRVALTVVSLLLACTTNAVPVRQLDQPRGDNAVAISDVVVAIKTRNTAKIEEIVREVSDPFSRQYGNHLRLDELCRLIEPEPDNFQLVLEWAGAHSAKKIDYTICKEFVVIEFPSSHRSRALQSANTIAHVVDFIDSSSKGLIGAFGRSGRSFDPATRRASSIVAATEGRDQGKPKPPGPWYPPCLKTSATPPCLRRLHNISSDASAAAGSQAVALFGPQFFRPTDLAAFDAKYGLPPATEHVLNDNDVGSAGNEASLDTQYETALGAGAESWFLHYACTTEACHPFLGWVTQLANLTRPPLVHSVSVGTTEWEYVDAMGEPYVARINLEFAKLAARGLTLLFAAGDRAAQPHAGRFWINFPAASPYVAAVGGVWLGELGSGPLVTDPDTTGGFANCPAHAQPAHQAAAVARYLATAAAAGAKRPDVFNSSLRAVPDLVSMSDAYVIIQVRIGSVRSASGRSGPHRAGP